MANNLLSVLVGFSDTAPVQLPLMLTQNMSPNPPVWTISYELLGSCVVLALVRLRRISQPVWVCTCFSLFALFGIREIGLFVIGHALKVESDRVHKLSEQWRFIIVLASCAAIGVCFFIDPFVPRLWLDTITGGLFTHYNALNGMHSIMGIACFLVAWLLTPVQRALRSQAAQYLGKLSFSIYLIHWPIMLGFGGALYLLVGAHPWIIFIAGVFITCWLATAFEHYVDAPAIALSRKIKPKPRLFC